jgi:hypothetical protein
MEKINIPVEEINFDSKLLKAWRERDYSMLENSQASYFLKTILIHKAKNRKQESKISDNRFFGEAYVATRVKMIDGWYNSYQWLKWMGESGSWVTGKGLHQSVSDPMNFKKIFFEKAICDYIELNNLLQLQRSAKLYQDENPGQYPKAPDLFIVDKEAHFLFIEVKLPGDKFHPLQDMGIKMIREHLRAKNGESVIVRKIRLIPSK